MTKFDEAEGKKKLAELYEKEAEDLARILAQKHAIPYLDLSRITIDLDSLKILSENEAREGEMAVFQSIGRRLQIAVKNPELLKTKEIVDDLRRKQYEPELFQVSEMSMKKAFSRYPEIPAFVEVSSGIIDISPAKLESFKEKVTGLESLKELLTQVSAARESRKVSEVVEILLAGSLSLEASDIHIEPEEDRANIRFRLDGVLVDVISFTKNIYQLLASRIKLISEIKLNIKDRAQDGRFTIRTKEHDIEARTAVLPGPYGESIVLRVLQPQAISMSFENLGMRPELLEIIASELKRPNGMILTTGPTGSGKTTTLYAFIKKIATPEIKIVTIEDPIEYRLPGITQTQVDQKKGYDFSNGLRSILRQDPDIILVGEIRDFETAEISMHAALTGHLVFSTLHTNDAAGTIPRLIDLGVKPNIIAPAINVSMAQRLVRKLCPNCAKKTEAENNELEFIKKGVRSLPAKYKKPELAGLTLPRPGKCKACNETGYKGRVGIFEAILIDEKMERMILESPSEAAILNAAKEQGILTLTQDGILKVLEGITSLEELRRVAGE
ncbi:type II/IV secretion system protein [Candidatus Giovannonibacteria bacterium]|nr:type II/IV secretion system protein [Candidatus Giovannonibacteria bacterium]